MTDRRHPVVPRVFFLNEKHELAHADKEGGGRLPKLAPTNHYLRASRLCQTRKTMTASSPRTR